MKPNCPVCGKVMAPTANINLFICPERKKIDIDGEPYEYTDGSVHLGVDEDIWRFALQVYEIPPYKFVIHDNVNQTETRIEKVCYIHDTIKRAIMHKSFEYKVILTLDFPISLPWSQPEEVFKKLKTYTVFS